MIQCSLRDMSIFVAAYEERSFTAAAQRENATQSGVSQHMRNLEYLLGVQLFLRERGGVTPTPAAAGFYRNCLKVLRAHGDARADIARFAKGEAGEIRIGLMPTVTSRVLSPALAAFLRASPNVNVRIVEGYSANLNQKVQAGELDCAIVPHQPTPPGLSGRFFVRTIETLVSAGGAIHEHLRPVRLRDVGPLRMVLPSPSNVRRQAIEAYCAANGVEVAEVVELDAMLATLDFVSQTDWVTILPAVMMFQHAGPRHLAVSPIIGPNFHIDLMTVEPMRRPMSALTKSFLDHLGTEARRVAMSWDGNRGLKAVDDAWAPAPEANALAERTLQASG
jgi:LysR family transcriptional regulator, nitrogen assimilation regulatory protein